MILVLALSAVACRKDPSLTPAAARALIEAAPAFNEPMASPSSPVDDGRVKEDAGIRREMLGVDSVTLKSDGPFGMAGATATAVFRWRWNQGPFAGQVFRTSVKLHTGGEGWKVYDDVLERELANAMRGQD